MAKNLSYKTARVEFRMPSSLKQEVEEAAALLGASFTSFATEILVERARQVKRDYALTVLSGKDREAFMDLIQNPPPPSEGLLKTISAKVNL